MIETLLEPLSYEYMRTALLVCTLCAAMCAALSSYLMLKGWSLMGDALAHSVVPGVALAYMLSLPFAIGAFFTGTLASFSMAFIKQKTKLKEDAVIGLVFTAFFAFGLVLISISPTPIKVQNILLGNALSISQFDTLQIVFIFLIVISALIMQWKNFMLLFFDKDHAQSVGLTSNTLNILFFALLSAACVASLQAVGAIMVIALLITPGATAYMLTDRFGVLIILSTFIGAATALIGAYLSFFLDTHAGGLIVLLQTLLFLTAFLFAPKHGMLFRKARLP